MAGLRNRGRPWDVPGEAGEPPYTPRCLPGFPGRIDRPVRPPDTLAGMGWDEFVLRPGDRAGASGRLVRTAHGTWFDPPLPVALVLIHPRPCRAQPLGQARHRRGAR